MPRAPRAAWAAWAAAGGATALAVGSTVFRIRRLRRRPATVREHRRVDLTPNPSGTGVAIVVNVGAGTADDALVADLRASLPEAEVRSVAGEDLEAALRSAARSPGRRALGVAGGDGSVNVAAAAASAHDLPLVVVPGGTLNHLARDLGVRSVDDAARALAAGTAVAIDLARVGDRPFLNTASFGSYTALVDAREALEGRIGKWPAVLVAGWRVLRRGTPIEVELDGSRRRLWMVFVGSCRYEPEGFAPSHRPRLDDDLLDVRWIDADQPLARVRLVVGLLLGRLGRSPVYHEHTATSLHVRSGGGPLRLACDGETFDGDAEVTLAKRGERVLVYSSAPSLRP